MTRKPDDWMPLHIGAYQADTMHLSRDQHGAYLLLLMAYWRKGGPLPADDCRLSTIAKATMSEWRKLKPIIAEFFTEEDGLWKQKRADEELAKAKAITAAKAAAGTKGAQKRWQTDSTAMAEPLADASISQCQTDAPIPLPKQVSSLRSDTRAEAFELPDWLPHDEWSAFVAMRVRLRAPLTDRAILLAIRELEKLRAQGHEPAAVLDQSTMNGWKGLFPITVKNQGNANGKRETAHDRFLAGARAFIEECEQGDTEGRSTPGDDLEPVGDPLLPARLHGRAG